MGARGKRLLGAVLIMAVALPMAAGCGSDSDSGSATSEVGRAPADRATPSTGANKNSLPGKEDKPAAAPDPGGTASEVPVGEAAGQDRKLARLATLAVTAPRPGEVADRARTIAATAGGYAGQEELRTRRISMELVVPGEKLDPVLTELATLGEVDRREVSATDVTEQIVDVDSRIASQQASVDRIRELLARSGSVSEIATVEGELATRESELESLKSRKNALAGRVAMSTVTFSAEQPRGERAADEDDGILGGLADGWHGFLDFGEGLLRAVAVMLPFLVVFGVPVGAVLWWWRRRRRAASQGRNAAGENAAAESATSAE